MNIVKIIHVTAVGLSISGFVLRGFWMLSDSGMLRTRLVRITPHIIDTVLLGSAVYLTIQIQQYPFVNHWLTAKIVGLLVYIALGMVAFRFGKTRRVKALAWLAAITVFGYLIAVAITKYPYLFG